MNTAEHIAPPKTAASGPCVADFVPEQNAGCSSSVWLLDDRDHENPASPPEAGLPALIELILKDRPGLHRLLHARGLHAVLLPRFLAIAFAGFVLFGVGMSLVLTVSERWPALNPIHVWLNEPAARLLSYTPLSGDRGALAPWVNGNVARLVAAYAFGLVAASGVCLPSLYFYCLLAGVRMTMVEVVLHAVKAKAVSAVALVGILPIYVAVAMGAVIFNMGHDFISATMGLGLLLPFVAGFWGVSSLYDGFATLADTLPGRCTGSRKCFLRRLVASWSVCYSAVMPVMVYVAWEVISR